jgi:hypothetical protein
MMLLFAVVSLAAWAVVIASPIAALLAVKAYGNPGVDWVTFQFALRTFAAPWLLFLLGGLDGIETAASIVINPFDLDIGAPMWVAHIAAAFLFFIRRKMKSRERSRAASEASAERM